MLRHYSTLSCCPTSTRLTLVNHKTTLILHPTLVYIFLKAGHILGFLTAYADISIVQDNSAADRKYITPFVDSMKYLYTFLNPLKYLTSKHVHYHLTRLIYTLHSNDLFVQWSGGRGPCFWQPNNDYNTLRYLVSSAFCT